MTTTIHCNVQDSITLEEYIDFCHSTPELAEPEVTISSAEMLKKLANNSSFLANFLAEQLKQVENYNLKTDYTPPSFYLYQCPTFSVRAVLWQSCEEMANDDEAIAYGYGVAHNHHFNFLTCGYFGPGYRTVIYRYNPDNFAGLAGEKIELDQQEDTQLSRGKLMHYQHSRDVHVQYPPESLSLSINLIFPRHPDASIQSIFDPENKTIKGYLDSLPTTSAIIKAAMLLQNNDSIELLEQIATNHLCPRTRTMAFSTLINMNPVNKNKYRRLIVNDPDRYVREWFIAQSGKPFAVDM